MVKVSFHGLAPLGRTWSFRWEFIVYPPETVIPDHIIKATTADIEFDIEPLPYDVITIIATRFAERVVVRDIKHECVSQTQTVYIARTTTDEESKCQPKFARQFEQTAASYTAYGITRFNHMDWYHIEWLTYLKNFIISRIPGIDFNVTLLSALHDGFTRGLQYGGLGRLPDYDSFEHWVNLIATHNKTFEDFQSEITHTNEAISGITKGWNIRSINFTHCEDNIMPTHPPELKCSPKFALQLKQNHLYDAYGIVEFNEYVWEHPTWLDFVRSKIVERNPGLTVSNQNILTVYERYIDSIEKGGAGRLPDYNGLEFWSTLLFLQAVSEEHFDKVFATNSEITNHQRLNLKVLTIDKINCSETIVPSGPPADVCIPLLLSSITETDGLPYQNCYGLSEFRFDHINSQRWLNYLREFIANRNPNVNVSNTIISIVYQHYLKPLIDGGCGRYPEFTGLEFWVVNLANGTIDINQFSEIFANMDEVKQGQEKQWTQRILMPTEMKTDIITNN